VNARRMVADERRDLVAFLRTLSDDEWETASLCEGWRVRDVVAHVSYDAMSKPAYLLAALSGVLGPDRANARLVDADRQTPTSALTDKLETSVGRGLVATLAPKLALADVVVHHQDIRRPLGKAREVPKDRILIVLDHPDPFTSPRRRMRGLRFVATDVGWSTGDGPEVRGKGEAIALAMAGRPVVLDELEGDGVDLLRRRFAHS
jgi:uncharacterized protein (TIGR03083 family)